MSAVGDAVAAFRAGRREITEARARATGLLDRMERAGRELVAGIGSSGHPKAHQAIEQHDAAMLRVRHVVALLDAAHKAAGAYMDSIWPGSSGEGNSDMGHMRTHAHDHDDEHESRSGRSFAGPPDKWEYLRSAPTVDDGYRTYTERQAALSAQRAAGERPDERESIEAGPNESLKKIMNRRGRDRWQSGERAARKWWGGGEEAAYQTPEGKLRKVDCPVQTPSGVVAVEVKTYGRHRTVELADGSKNVQSVEVPLSGPIRDQIDKDVALREADPSFDPRWVFLGAGPSAELLAYLNQSRIIANIFHEPRQA